jgi:A/G-specific adenine glycosylase
MARQSPPGSVYSVSDSESDDSAPESSSPPPKAAGKRVQKARALPAKGKARTGSSKRKAGVLDIEDISVGHSSDRRHGPEYHGVRDVAALQEDLLSWFEGVR